MSVTLPTEGDRKSVGGVEYIYYGETGWVRVPKSRSEGKSLGYDDGPKTKPTNPGLHGDPEIDPTWNPGPPRTFNINEDPEVQGYGLNLPTTQPVPPTPIENANDNLDDPIAGSGPENNSVGSDADPDTPGLQGPGAIRVNPNGVVQQGREFSFRMPTIEEIETYTGRKLANPFSSNNLQVDAPAEDMMGRDAEQAAAIQDGGVVETTFNPDGSEEVEIKPNESMGLGVNQARSEFLAADDVMSGMKAKEAAQGLVFASGKYWIKNPNAGVDGAPELIEVPDSAAGGSSRQAIRDYKAGNMDAQSFFDNYVKKTQDEISTADEPAGVDPDDVEELDIEEEPEEVTVG